MRLGVISECKRYKSLPRFILKYFTILNIAFLFNFIKIRSACLGEEQCNTKFKYFLKELIARNMLALFYLSFYLNHQNNNK